MAPLTPVLVSGTEFAGEYKVLALTATLQSNDDTITLVAATHGIRTIVYADAHITNGMDANLLNVMVSWTGLAIRLRGLSAAGAAATIGGDETVELIVVGY